MSRDEAIDRYESADLQRERDEKEEKQTSKS